MSDFLKVMAEKIAGSHADLSTYTVITPTRRAASRLKKELTQLISKTTWLPEFLTINQWTERLSGLAPADNLELKFTCYKAYLEVLKGDAREISDFFSWGDILIRDFNDIEAQLIELKPFFKELTDYTEIEHFSFLSSPLSEKQERYRKFWNSIPKIHERFNELLLNKNLAYTGLLVRRAFENASKPGFENENRLFVLGFNAFSKAEISLLKLFQDRGEAEIFFDTDAYYLDQPENHAGVFIRRNMKSGLGKAESTPLSLTERKLDIEICEAAHRIDQAQVVSGLLNELSPEELKETVLVLADESLLIPVLDKLPKDFNQINITMGVGLSDSTFSSWMEALFDVATHKISDDKGDKFSVEKIELFLSHPFSKFLGTQIDDAKMQGLGYIPANELIENPEFNAEKWVAQAIHFWTSGSENRNEALIKILSSIAEKVELSRISTISILQAQKAISLVLRGLGQLQNFPEEKNLGDQMHFQILKRMIAGGSIDLLGEPHDKLQIMGILETRALTFKRVIICGVNEDVLPKKPNLESYIPFEIRNYHQLPGKKEKEAVYAYNFYRLISHADHVQLVYHTDKGDFSGGEKSRYIHQIEFDLKKTNPNLQVIYRHPERIPRLDPSVHLEVLKTPEVIAGIRRHLESGISISSINRYLDDPLDWYYNYVVRLREPDKNEIDVATFGSVVHDVLENLYKPYLGKIVDEASLMQMEGTLEDLLANATNEIVQGKNIDTGINKIHLETAKSLLKSYLKSESKRVKSGEETICIGVEDRLTRQLSVQTLDDTIEVSFKGFVDKVQRRDGMLEILDYKTGNAEPKDMKIIDFSLENMAKVPKAVQLMTYNWMASEMYTDMHINSRIISLPAPNKQGLEIAFHRNDKEVLESFEGFLKEVILEMLNPEIRLEKNPEFEYANYE